MKIEARLARTITIGRRTVACERHEEDACTIRFGPEPASNLVCRLLLENKDDERDVRVSRLEQLEPNRAIFSQQYLMPCQLEQHAIHLTGVLIVFHDKYTSPGHLCAAEAKTVPYVFLLGSIPEQSRLAVSTVGETRAHGEGRSNCIRRACTRRAITSSRRQPGTIDGCRLRPS